MDDYVEYRLMLINIFDNNTKLLEKVYKIPNGNRILNWWKLSNKELMYE